MTCFTILYCLFIYLFIYFGLSSDRRLKLHCRCHNLSAVLLVSAILFIRGVNGLTRLIRGLERSVQVRIQDFLLHDGFQSLSELAERGPILRLLAPALHHDVIPANKQFETKPLSDVGKDGEVFHILP